MLVKMVVLVEINFKIKEKLLAMQTLKNYFGFLEPPPPPQQINMPG
jgi:hypothetical protein